MPVQKPIRQSVSLSPHVARRVRALVQSRRESTSRVIADLVESGLDAHDRARQHFLELADRLTRETDPAEQRGLKEELARLTFGD